MSVRLPSESLQARKARDAANVACEPIARRSINSQRAIALRSAREPRSSGIDCEQRVMVEVTWNLERRQGQRRALIAMLLESRTHLDLTGAGDEPSD